MKARIIVCTLLFGGVLLPIGLGAEQDGGKLIGGPAGVKAPYNPKPFQNFVASPSAPVRFFLSDAGKAFLRQSSNPAARDILGALGENVPAAAPSAPSHPALSGRVPGPTAPGVISTPANGALFNLEPVTSFLPQNEEAVDFIRGGAGGGNDLVVGGANDFRELSGGFTGYYVSRDATVTPEFEGGLPSVADPLQSGDTLEGGGDPVVAADPARGAVFMADLRFDGSTTGVGVFRTTSATLLAAASCPGGTNTSAQAAICWPTKTVVNPLPFPFFAYFQDKPHLAVDERAAGVGAGNVYVAATEFNFVTFFSRIWIVACNNALTACSVPTLISGGDTSTQFPHVSVRPDGGITLTYVNVLGFAPQNFQIKYVSCAPSAAPSTPSCAPAVLVHNETQPLPFGGFLGAQDFRIATYPKHDHRRDGGGTETYVVWDRCKVPPIFAFLCPDADVVMKGTTTNTWTLAQAAAAPIAVNISVQDQFFPWIETDHSRNIVNIVYYDSQPDPTFQHRVVVPLNHINTDGVLNTNLISDTHSITTVLNDPSSDLLLGGFFFGDYISVAARGTGAAGASRAYAHFTYNDVNKNCGGVSCPQQDNKIGRFNY